MKYIKLFEELSPSTYKKASDILHKRGHYDRSYKLSKYANEISNSPLKIKNELISSNIFLWKNKKSLIVIHEDTNNLIHIDFIDYGILNDLEFKKSKSQSEINNLINNYVIASYSFSKKNILDLRIPITRKEANQIKKLIKLKFNIDVPTNSLYSDKFLNSSITSYERYVDTYLLDLKANIFTLSENELDIIYDILPYEDYEFHLKRGNDYIKLPLFALKAEENKYIAFAKDSDDYYYSLIIYNTFSTGNIAQVANVVYKLDQFESLLEFIDDIK